MKYDTIIIGAGMSGLAAGIRLSHFGQKVCILEKHAIAGGLNSHYSKDGRRFDVGLHAMTNFVERGKRRAPMTKLLKQLRIPYDSLDLVEQGFSTVSFPDAELKFGNSHTLIEDSIAEVFPDQIDNYRRFVKHVEDYDDVSLTAEYVSAKKVVAEFISEPVLCDMLFCPLMYYGSAVEDDMDFSQYCIMFKSIFLEGFCRPQIGVRHLLRILQNRYKENGGELKMRHGVRKVLTKNSKAYGVELENGDVLESDTILSSAGIYETMNLVDSVPQSPSRPGALSFVESIFILDTMPADLGIDETIIFFSHKNEFQYKKPRNLAADPSSGVICIPNNFQFEDKPLKEGIIRFTNLADFDTWKNCTPEEYQAAKAAFVKQQIDTCSFGDKFKDHIIYTDSFTPTTVLKYTSHANGAIYGSPDKIKDGRTDIDGLFIIGTDQGFLGIVGALLSGISMANLHALR